MSCIGGEQDPVQPTALPITYFDTATFRGIFRLLAHNSLHQTVVGGVLAAVNIEFMKPSVPLSELPTFNMRAKTLEWHPHRRGQELTVDVNVSRVLNVGTPQAQVEELWRSKKTFIFFNKGGDKPQAESTENKWFEDVEKGAPKPRGIDFSGNIKTEDSDGVLYASVCGDSNPIHVSTLGAKAFGFRKPIAHGKCSAQLLLTTAHVLPKGMCIVEKATPFLFFGAQKLAEEEGARSNCPLVQTDLQVVFKRPTFLGSDLKVEVWKCTDAGGFGKGDFSVNYRVVNHDGKVVQGGRASFLKSNR